MFLNAVQIFEILLAVPGKIRRLVHGVRECFLGRCTCAINFNVFLVNEFTYLSDDVVYGILSLVYKCFEMVNSRLLSYSVSISHILKIDYNVTFSVPPNDK